MKNLYLCLLLTVSVIGCISSERDIPAIENIYFKDALENIEEIRNLGYLLQEKKKDFLADDNRSHAEDLYEACIIKCMTSDNLFKFFIFNNINEPMILDVYDIKNDINKDTVRFFRVEVLAAILSESDLKQLDGIFEPDILSNLKILEYEGNEIVGKCDFDIFKDNGITGKFLFKAIKVKNNRWIIQELRIAKKESDKLEDGLLVYLGKSGV